LPTGSRRCSPCPTASLCCFFFGQFALHELFRLRVRQEEGRDGDERMGGARMLLLMLLLSTSFVTLFAEQELGAAPRPLCFWRTRGTPARSPRAHPASGWERGQVPEWSSMASRPGGKAEQARARLPSGCCATAHLRASNACAVTDSLRAQSTRSPRSRFRMRTRPGSRWCAAGRVLAHFLRRGGRATDSCGGTTSLPLCPCVSLQGLQEPLPNDDGASPGNSTG
jgi:hypothetical protein